MIYYYLNRGADVMDQFPNFSRFLNTHGLKAKRFNDKQKVLIDKITYLLEETSYNRYLVRFCIFFLLHCGEDFFASDIARICRYTDRQLQNIKGQDEKSFINSLWGIHKAGRHSKVAPELVGKIVSFLVKRPISTREEIRQFLKEEYNIDASCRTIDRLLKTYGLKDLLDQER